MATSRRTWAAALAAALLSIHPGLASAQSTARPPQLIRVPATLGDTATLDLHAYLPAGATTPVPAIIAFHGCGGLFAASGAVAARERAFVARFTAQGYAVVLPDSFNPRGVRQLCTTPVAQRTITVANRIGDVHRVIRWLENDAPAAFDGRYALVGWSHGASTVLGALDAARWPANLPAPAAAFTFYPGCANDIAKIPATVGALTMFIAGDDNWTLPQPCVDLADRLRAASSRVELRLFEGAVHGFDSPSSKPRTRSDVPLVRAGQRVQVKVGTHPVARELAYQELGETLARRLAVRGPSTSGGN